MRAVLLVGDPAMAALLVALAAEAAIDLIQVQDEWALREAAAALGAGDCLFLDWGRASLAEGG